MANSTCALIGLVLLLVLVVEHPISTSAKEVAEDSVTSLMLENIIKRTMAKYNDTIEPLNITEKGFTYERGVGRFRARAVARLLNIKLYGLSTTRRSGNVDLTKPDDITSLLTINLLMSNLKYSASGEITVLGFGFRRRFKGKLDKVHAKVLVRYNLARDVLSITHVKVIDMKGLKLTATGNSIFTTISDAIINRFIRLSISYLNQAFRIAIELALKTLFEETISDPKIGSVIKGIMD